MSLTPSRLLAIDPSLRQTGWVLFDVAKEEPLQVGTLCALGTGFSLAERLQDFQNRACALIADMSLGEMDILVCEGPAPLQLNPQSAIKVEHIRGIFETLARSRGVLVPGRVNPRTVQTEILGMRGPQIARKEVKTWAANTAERLFGKKLLSLHEKKTLNQDIVDAALIGALVLARIRMAERLRVELSTLLQEGQKRSRSRARAVWDESAVAGRIRKKG